MVTVLSDFLGIPKFIMQRYVFFVKGDSSNKGGAVNTYFLLLGIPPEKLLAMK